MPDFRALWRSARCVCFDIDSTVIHEEGIDVLAAFAGVGEAVAALTRQAMGGTMRFEDALRARLDIIKPTRHMIADCQRAHPFTLSPHIADLVSTLRARGTHLHLITGGFWELIAPIADALGFDADHVSANRFRFDAHGAYLSFDETCPTSRSGGKAVAIAQLARRHDYTPLVMIGDGVTDLEARPPADAFIGYGGVIVREKVKREADWFVTDFRELIDALA